MRSRPGCRNPASRLQNPLALCTGRAPEKQGTVGGGLQATGEQRENSRERQPSHDSCPYASYGAVHSCPQSRVHCPLTLCRAVARVRGRVAGVGPCRCYFLNLVHSLPCTGYRHTRAQRGGNVQPNGSLEGNVQYPGNYLAELRNTELGIASVRPPPGRHSQVKFAPL